MAQKSLKHRLLIKQLGPEQGTQAYLEDLEGQRAMLAAKLDAISVEILPELVEPLLSKLTNILLPPEKGGSEKAPPQ